MEVVSNCEELGSSSHGDPYRSRCLRERENEIEREREVELEEINHGGPN